VLPLYILEQIIITIRNTVVWISNFGYGFLKTLSNTAEVYQFIMISYKIRRLLFPDKRYTRHAHIYTWECYVNDYLIYCKGIYIIYDAPLVDFAVTSRWLLVNETDRWLINRVFHGLRNYYYVNILPSTFRLSRFEYISIKILIFRWNRLFFYSEKPSWILCCLFHDTL